MNLKGKVALVTGAARGIGAAIAKKLAEGGADVAICDLKAEWCDETVKALEACGVKAKGYGVNVAVSSEVDACVKAVLADFGKIDVMVNNAGITKDGLLMRMSDDDWDAVLDVNLKGTFLFTRAVSRPMMKNKAADGTQLGGSIINIASVVGIMGNAGQANYTASKGGVIALTKTTAKELGSRNVRCNAVAPGFIQSKMTDVLPEDVKKAYMETIPLKRFGPAEDIAKCVAWLASDESSYVTGQIISVNGGMIGIAKFAKIAHKNGVPLIVDNTFPTPILCRPFEFGCDIVTHATTKYMDGHSSQVGGCIVDSGNFDWTKHPDRFGCLVDPDPSYHGLSYTKQFGKMAYIVKCTAQLMRDYGAIPSPFNAFLVNIGLESLHVRIRRHAESALKIAKWLKTQKKVAWVKFAGLPDSPYHKLLKKQFDGPSPCGVMTFGIKGGRAASIRFMDALKLIGIVTHVADAWSCVLHPASHTHRQLTDKQLEEAGIPPDLIRLSVGLEDPDDLIADLKQALAKVK